MNAMLHDIEGDLAAERYPITSWGEFIPSQCHSDQSTVWTKKGGGLPTRDDFTFVTSNKQLAFLQHIYRGCYLATGGSGHARQCVV